MISLLSCTCIVAQDILCNLAVNIESVSINIGICRRDGMTPLSPTVSHVSLTLIGGPALRSYLLGLSESQTQL